MAVIVQIYIFRLHRDRYPIDKPAAIALRRARRADSPLRLKTNFLNRIKLIWGVQSFLKKYFGFSEPQITSISIAVSPHRGACHDRRIRGVRCDGRKRRS